MLRLQLDPHAEPKRIGIFAPEELRRWTTLPSSALASDGRSDAARTCKADDTSASLRAELVTQRGRHEEEKRQLLEMLQDLQLRHAELENLSDEGGVERKFGSRIRGLAQRLKSPYPRGILDEAEEILRFSEEDDVEINQSTLSFGESREAEMTPRISLINSQKENPSTPGYGESSKVIAALEEQLRLTEQRATILEKRLQIVKESGDAVIQSLNEELADVADDRARSEAAMIKEIRVQEANSRLDCS
jgi:chaperonin cofactor prefoldin